MYMYGLVRILRYSRLNVFGLNTQTAKHTTDGVLGVEVEVDMRHGKLDTDMNPGRECRLGDGGRGGEGTAFRVHLSGSQRVKSIQPKSTGDTRDEDRR